MELIMLLVALFVFFFGSVAALKLMDFGLLVGDKALNASGALMKLPFKLAFKLIVLISKVVIRKYMTRKTEEIQIRPIFAVTPLELQQMRNSNLLQSGKRPPVLIEHPPQKSK